VSAAENHEKPAQLNYSGRSKGGSKVGGNGNGHAGKKLRLIPAFLII
jgi:hypothetical protein